jgi:ribonuclease HII
MPSLPVIGGDAAAACIAAASVLAKVSRDRLMVAMETEHPGYGFAEHKGYSTPAHSRRWPSWAPAPAPLFVHQRPAGGDRSGIPSWWRKANRTPNPSRA